MAAKAKARYPRSRPNPQTIEDLLRLANIGPDEWDLLLIGDGSGTIRDRACGFAAVSIDRETRERLTWIGSCNRGTSNFAEAMAYVAPLEYFAIRERTRPERGLALRTLRVFIVTDSQYIKNIGSASNAVTANIGPWTILRSYGRVGLNVKWRWVRRSWLALNRFVDGLAGLAREASERYDVIQEAVERNPAFGTADELNKDDSQE